MTYSAFGLLAVLINLIVNYDIFHKRVGSSFPAIRQYRLFLICVITYCLVDALWGFLYYHHLSRLLFINTSFYFTIMALCVLFWTSFVVEYLEEKNFFCTAINYIGKLFFLIQLSTVGANFFVPIIFHVAADCSYHPKVMRYVLFILQILIMLNTSLYSIFITAKSKGSKKRRHLTIALFGFSMILAITAQLIYTFLPLYSIGYMIGCCVLHTFVVEDERAENISALKESLNREAIQIEELGATRTLAYTDPLTGVKSKRAYIDIRKQIEQKIEANTMKEFALAVFDVNNLKVVNDNFGHDVGDQHIIGACSLICSILKHSPVFRIGGDEFVAILEGSDFEERRSLISDFNSQIEENARTGKVVVSVGLSTYKQNAGATFASIFKQADENMYKRKAILKEMR